MKFNNDVEFLESVAAKVGTPFWIYDAGVLRRRIGEICEVTRAEGLQARYAMKACSTSRVLEEMKRAGIWIDAVSGNECLRARHVGFPDGMTPPAILFTADVFRDQAFQVLLDQQILPNLGSPGMLEFLIEQGFRRPIALRVNPGFGHGHVNECDTGGPSSKHGIWMDDLARVADRARSHHIPVTMLHAHVGSGPSEDELMSNLNRLVATLCELIPSFPDLEAVNLGGWPSL